MNCRLVAALLACGSVLTSAQAAPVVLVSIDGLHPDYVLKADKLGLRIPNLRNFVATGSYAEGVVGVVPTITYPSHTTIITGVTPKEHGIYANLTFDPLNTNKDGWYWYAEDLRAPTLWQAAKQMKLKTASVNWPVTVGDTNIDYLIPEYWRASTTEDLKVLRTLSRPEGLLKTMEASLGSYVDGNTETTQSDQIRARFTTALLRKQKPDFMATHLITLDGVEHESGPFTPQAGAALEAIDTLIGNIVKAAVETNPDTVVVVVSDHGFIATHTTVNLRAAFVKTGLIKLKEQPNGAPPTIASWDSQVWMAGASAAIVLKEPNNSEVKAKVSGLLDSLKADKRNGIARVLTKKEALTLNGLSSADFVIELEPGYYFGSALRGEVVTPSTLKGMHGYFPERPEMHAAFFISGKDIAKGRSLGVIDMRRIAPTLANLLGLEFGQMSGRLNVSDAQSQ